MKIIKTIIFFTVILAANVASAQPSMRSSWRIANSSSNCMGIQSAPIGKTLNVYFVQNGRGGSIEPVNTKEGLYKLTLKNTNPYVVYFSDRPQRIVHAIPTEKFMKLWYEGNNSLSVNPPNASLSAVTLSLATGFNTEDLFLALSHPEYNAKEKTMSYLAYNLDKNTIIKKQNFHFMTLFIDNGSFCASCI